VSDAELLQCWWIAWRDVTGQKFRMRWDGLRWRWASGLDSARERATLSQDG